jgi:hypothetical protein
MRETFDASDGWAVLFRRSLRQPNRRKQAHDTKEKQRIGHANERTLPQDTLPY